MIINTKVYRLDGLYTNYYGSSCFSISINTTFGEFNFDSKAKEIILQIISKKILDKKILDEQGLFLVTFTCNSHSTVRIVEYSTKPTLKIIKFSLQSSD